MKELNKTPGKHYWERLLEEDYLPRLLFDGNHESSLLEAKKAFKKFVCIVNIETSTYCNRLCSYCPVSIFDRKNQIFMRDEVYSRIIDDLESIDYSSTISLNLYNEPLADNKIIQRIFQARATLTNSFIKFNSNGDFLTKEMLDALVDAGANAVFITLHPNPKEEWIEEFRLNHFRKFFKRIDIDYRIDEIVPNVRISSDIEYRGLRLLVQSHNWGDIGNDRGGTIQSLSSDSCRYAPCVRPLREFTISYDGSVYPCCQFFTDDIETHQYKVGTIDKESTIFSVYASIEMSKWRKHLFGFNAKSSPCSTCKDPDFADDESTELRSKIIDHVNQSQSKNIPVNSQS